MTRNADLPDPVAQVGALLEHLSLTAAARCLATVLAQAETTCWCSLLVVIHLERGPRLAVQGTG